MEQADQQGGGQRRRHRRVRFPGTGVEQSWTVDPGWALEIEQPEQPGERGNDDNRIMREKPPHWSG